MTVLGRAVLVIVALSLTTLSDGQGTESANETEPVNVTLPSTEVCGKPSGRFNRIVGGSDAEPGMFPWIAAIGAKYYFAERWLLLGTASLVTELHLVTTSDCIHDIESIRDQVIYRGPNNISRILSDFVARFGGFLDIKQIEPTGTEVDYELDTWASHPRYDYDAPRFEIAILKMKKRVTFSRFIQPICLPVLSELKAKNFTGSTGYIAGWGWPQYDGETPTRLQQTQVQIWDLEECKKAYEHTKVKIGSHHFCAVSDDDDSEDCRGPIMMPYGPDCNYYLYGVAKFYRSCGTRSSPNAIVYVSDHIDWILTNLISL